MTYSHMGNPTLPSALRGFTSEFGKGSGGSLLLWSPAQLFMTLRLVLFICQCLVKQNSLTGISELSYFVLQRSLNQAVLLNIESIDALYNNCLGVVQSSLTSNQYWSASHITMLPHPTYQRRSLQRLFRRHKVSGKSYLEVGFPLRCFQRLSLPNIATRRCDWRHNRYTRGSSTLVLSYQEQILSNFQRPRQIGTELSHDVLNPARVPL